MRSDLWFLLILGASSATADEISSSQEYAFEPRPSASPLADAIYSKQKECESIVGEAVVKALDEEAYPKFPEPDEKYRQCKKFCYEKKREYIKTAFIGLPPHSTEFPLRLSNGQIVMVPVPSFDNPSQGTNDNEFDVTEELCAINKVCIDLIRNNVEKDLEHRKRFARCADLLNNIKLKYIHMKKLNENELKKAKGLPVKCTGRTITFTLPPQMNDLDYHTTSHSIGSTTSEIKPVPEKVVSSEESGKETVDHHKLHSEVMAELKSRFEENGKDQGISDKLNSGKKSSENIPSDDAQKDSKLFKSNLQDVKKEDAAAKDAVVGNHNKVSSPLEKEIQFNNKAPNEKVTTGSKIKEKGIQQKDKKASDSVNNSETASKEMLSTKKEDPKNTSTSANNSPSAINNGNEETKQDKKRTKVTSSKNKNSKPPKTDSDEDVKLLTYRVNLLSKDREGKVVKIQAVGRIKKTESGKTSVDTTRGQDNNLWLNTKQGIDTTQRLSQVYEEKSKLYAESLEENIIIMENDCKELLRFGEQLLKNKILSSLVNFENHYNECIRKLDGLKKMYIEKYKMDAMSHKNIFPVTLPSGIQKLVMLPTQLLKTGLVETLPSSKSTSSDIFEEAELGDKVAQSESPTATQRKPFDDPAFIPNDEFFERLKQESASTDTSTLSKVASMLHMNGGHVDKKVAE